MCGLLLPHCRRRSTERSREGPPDANLPALPMTGGCPVPMRWTIIIALSILRHFGNFQNLETIARNPAQLVVTMTSPLLRTMVLIFALISHFDQHCFTTPVEWHFCKYIGFILLTFFSMRDIFFFKKGRDGFVCVILESKLRMNMKAGFFGILMFIVHICRLWKVWC